MVAGFGGDLISHAYVEQELLPAAAGIFRDRLTAFERQLIRWWRQVSRSLGPASSARTVLDVAVAPLLHLLGHDRPAVTPHPLGLCGSVSGSGVALVTLPWSTPVRTAWRDAALGGLAGHASWAMVSNGRSLRIVDCARPWTRLGLEFDFEILTASPKGVAALWWLANAEAMRTVGVGSLRASIASSDAHAARVCNSLGDGVLAALPRLASALTPGASPRHAAATFDQALTVVYRILFLLFAEARGAVPVWHELYRDAYTIEALTRRAGTAHARGLWAALQAISRLAHVGCKAGRPRSHRLQRPALLTAACATGRAAPRARRGGPRRAALARHGIHATGTPSHLVSRPGRRTTRLGLRARPRIRTTLARRYDPVVADIDRAQSHRQLLYAAIDHGIPRSPHACRRWSKAGRPIRSSSCACSIPPWAAARFSWRPASSSPTTAKRR